MLADPASHTLKGRRAIAAAFLQFDSACVDQEIPHMAGDVASFALPRDLNRLLSDQGLRRFGPKRDLFDDVSIAIAGDEIHLGVHPLGVVAQHAIDQTHAFEGDAPVEMGQLSQTPNRVRQRYLITGVVALLMLNHISDRRRPSCVQATFERIPMRWVLPPVD